MSKSALITNVEEESDIDLIAAVGLADDDPETAQDALRALHFRHSAMCLRLAWNRKYSGIDSEMAVSKTFVKIWRNAEKFNPEKRGKRVSRENAAKNWIFQILENEIISEIRERSARNEIALWDGFGERDEEDATDAAGQDLLGTTENRPDGRDDGTVETPLPAHKALFEELRQSLSAKEQIILDLSAPYIDPHPPFACHIPQDQLQHLASQVGVAPSSIKVLRQRAYQKLRRLAEAHNTTRYQSE